MNASKLVTVTDDLETRIREDKDEFVLVRRASSDNCSLHIPDEDGGPLCDRVARREHFYENSADWKRKATAVFPPGYKDICRFCATEWKDE